MTEDSLVGLRSLRAAFPQKLNFSSVFVLPEWLEVWWQAFGEDTGMQPWVRRVQDGPEVVGIAPLMVGGNTAQFIGSTDVCDYVDFIIAPGREEDFFTALLDDLARNGIRRLDLRHVRHDATVLNFLVPFAQRRGLEVVTIKENVSLEMDLPASFEAYLELLSAKQRHEVRRKLRRLHEEGTVAYRFISEGEALSPALDSFFRMFVESRRDKASFMTAKMEAFFRNLASVMSQAGLLKLGALELDGQVLAEIMCFDYQGCIYLYNSGYDPKYTSLSAGLLSKVMAIEQAIRAGKRRFDFLKGAEAYKYHLGGREVPLYRCQIAL